MKSNVFLITLTVIFLMTLNSSCSKDDDFFIPMDNADDSALKGAKVKGVVLTPLEQLGRHIFFDKISVPSNTSCASCHAARTGFTGPNANINKRGAVYPGANRHVFGARKPPSAAYATFSPVLHYDDTRGGFVGGNFWDGRATGDKFGNPAADQAQGPFLNPVRHNVFSVAEVVGMIAVSEYVDLFEEVWGATDFNNPSEVDAIFDQVALSIAAYEASLEVSQFSSKYDYYLLGLVDLTDQEELGLELFENEDKGNCAACHPSIESPPVPPGGPEVPPVFTDFTYDNVGVPSNPENPEILKDPNFMDLGLGGWLATHSSHSSYASVNVGKFKVPTLRNVDKRPGKGFPKAYMHNGVFKSLKEVVHFYNTRDVESWPPPEVLQNMNTDELGDLGLTDTEEDAIVAFLKTLSDGYKLK